MGDVSDSPVHTTPGKKICTQVIVSASPPNSCELAPSHPGSSEKSLWFHKRSHVVGSRYLPCVMWEETTAKRNSLPTSQAIRKWPGSFLCPTVLWETKSASFTGRDSFLLKILRTHYFSSLRTSWKVTVENESAPVVRPMCNVLAAFSGFLLLADAC